MLAQSAEPGKAFNAYMAPESGINPLSGTVAFTKPLASISAGALSVSFDLSYSGNVFKSAQNRNDIAPGGWVALGWNLGRASIVSDPNGSMILDDDSYYLQTAAGLRYRIIKEKSRWWIEHLPYWKVAPDIVTVIWNNKEYQIIRGWLITDDSGLKHRYGDYEDDPKNPLRNATEHILAFPEHYGLVGRAISGNAALYPHVWNISMQEDLDGNWLKYRYDQVFEGLKIKNWSSAKSYTKESYLSAVTSSLGSSIEFISKDKGEGEFDGEFLDVQGKHELPGETPDAFIDPVMRKYLSSIEIKGEGGVKNGKIEFCYKSFSIQPDGKKVHGYVKRLLTSVVHMNDAGIEIDRETYNYSTDVAQASSNKAYPAAALHSIEGPNCGRIEFTHTSHALRNENKDFLYFQKLNLINVTIGYLDNGMPYLVGHHSGEKKVKTYLWQNGEWTFVNNVENVSYNAEGKFEAGDKNWFAYYTGTGDSYTVYAVVWNGKNFSVQNSVKDNGENDVVVTGPGYIARSHIGEDKIQLTIPWTRWGKTYQTEVFAAEDGSLDRSFIKVIPSQNHIALFYLGQDWGNNGKLKIFTFDYSKNTLAQTYDSKNLDDDNSYTWGDGYLFGAMEDSGLLGTTVRAWHWTGEGWSRELERKLHGVQGTVSIQATGDNYFAVRHNDNDDLSLFDFDGENWNKPYENKNLVSGDDFDFFYEAQWTGESGREFFIAREPKVTTERIRVCLVGIPFVGCVVRGTVFKWTSTEHARLLQRFERRDGTWYADSPRNLSDAKTNILTGENWYADKTSGKIFVWDGLKWNEDVLNVLKDESQSLTGSYSSGYNPLGSVAKKITEESTKKISGGNFFKTQSGSETIIYYKKDDRFRGNVSVPLVTEKTVYDPVTDQTVTYEYDYVLTDRQVAFDFVQNTPLILNYYITLRGKAGKVKKTLCAPEGNNPGLGQVCTEETLNELGDAENRRTVIFERYRNPDWSSFIYQDRIFKEEVQTKGIKTVTETKFNDNLNGLPSQILVKNAGKTVNEKRITYAAEAYPFMREANRLREEAGYLSCTPSCAPGSVIQGGATRYAAASAGISKAHISDVWNFEPKTKTSTAFGSFNWNSATQVADWKKVTVYSEYRRGRATESRDRLGVKSSLVYEDQPAGLLLGTVANAGINEVLLLPGETCTVANISFCKTKNLLGNATAGNGINYGRFSKTVIRVSSEESLKGSVPVSKGGSYRFSAWVQSADAVNRELRLALNGSQVSSWNFAANESGKWKYVEWEGNVASGQIELSLSLPSGTELRLQDIRFLPSDAVSAVSFWDRRFGVPLVQVDNLGKASYATLDEIGRPFETYIEDVDGNVLLVSRKTYIQSDCRDNTVAGDRLSKLTINGNSVHLGGINGTLYYTLPDGDDFISVNAIPMRNGDAIRYQLYPAGVQNPSWISSCCSVTDEVTEKTGTNTAWILKVDVAPFGVSSAYTVHIQKRSAGWVDYGMPLGRGETPRYLANHDSAQFVFMSESKNGLASASFTGNTWTQTKVSEGTPEEFAAVSSTNAAYVLNKPLIMNDATARGNSLAYSKNASAWSSLGYITEDMGDIRKLRLSSNASGNVYALYENYGEPLKALRYNAAQVKWEPVGGTLLFTSAEQTEPLEFTTGTVSDASVTDADLVFGADNRLYTAYIGSVSGINLFEEPEDTVRYSPKFVVIKRLYSAAESKANQEVWAGPSQLANNNGEVFPNYFGDILMLDTVPVMQARRVRLAGDGENLYAAVVYQIPDDTISVRNVLSVFKGSYRNEGQIRKLVFETLPDTSIKQTLFTASLAEEQRTILYLDESDHFDFTVKNGVPYVSFINKANDDKLSVIRYEGKRWLSVGSPAFAHPVYGTASADMAIGKNGTPVVAFEETKFSQNTTRRNQIVPKKYVKTGDFDLTLSSLNASNVTSLNSGFRQYLLNYSASVLSSVNSITLSPVPKTIGDVIAVRVENNEELVSTWVINSSSMETGRYLPEIIPGFTGNRTRPISIPLAEGLNQIKVTVIGKDGSMLSYRVALNRAFLPKGGSTVFGDCHLEPQIGDTAVYTSYCPDSSQNICVQLAAGQILTYRDSVYYRSVCLDIDLKDSVKLDIITPPDNNGGDTTYTPIIIIRPGGGGSSSSTISSSSIGGGSSSSTAGGSDSSRVCIPPPGQGTPPNGINTCITVNEKCYICNPDRESECNQPWLWDGSQVGQTWWFIEVPCSGGGSSSSTISSSSSSIGGGGSSSSSLPGSSSSSAGGSDSSRVCIPPPGQGIPPNGINTCITVNEKCYICNPARGNDCNSDWLWDGSQVGQTWWFIEVPCSGGGSSSSTISSSSSSIGGGGSSSSSLPGSSSSSAGGSGNGDIPQEFEPLLKYRLLSTGDLILADNASVTGGTFGGSFVEVGARASLTGELISSGNVQLRSNATTENITLSGVLDKQAGASHGEVVQTQVSLPAIPQVSVAYGTADQIIGNNQTANVSPGSYKDFRAYSNAKVTFEPGDYYFESFAVEPDVQLYFNNSNGAVRIWVERDFTIADRVNLQNTNTPSKLFFYTNTSNILYFGVGSEISAVLVAPNGSVNLAPHSRWSGSVWAKKITLQPAVLSN
ncbi:MAG: cadherin-like beta sandwich domain-containing protein [Fibrobacter sp.]|nr:cadherin-like beta sandwich domain-containing protein [Fibrobacter sp.]